MPQKSPADLAINYIAILGRRSNPNIPVFPPEGLDYWMFSMFGSWPHSLLHYLLGCDYYQLKFLIGEQAGYQLTFIYAEDLAAVNKFILDNGVNVILICTEDKKLIPQINIELARIHRKNNIYWVDDKNSDSFILQNKVHNNDEFFAFLYKYCSDNKLIERFASHIPLSVPLFAHDFSFLYFNPCNVNSDTLNTAVGNWGYHEVLITEQEHTIIEKKSKEARENLFGTERQDKLTNQLKLFQALQHASVKGQNLSITFSDQFSSPLILAVPFTSVDVRKTLFEKLPKEIGNMKIAKTLKYVLSLEYSTNYCLVPDTNYKGDISEFYVVSGLVNKSRSNYLDFIGRLHSSFRFSPYFRTPFIGKSINEELSFVGAKVNARLNANNGTSVMTVIERVGESIASKTFANDAKEMIMKWPIQIVTISDLPVEWVRIGGIPLGFTHDICRIPETPSGGQLMHYEIARLAPSWKIPQNILSKTLVVYGCRSDAFVEYQNKVDFLASSLGFKTEICLSKEDFFKIVKSFSPDLLIIDSHGDTDMKSHQSFIWMGDDKVYPADIAANKLHVKLVFLSACNSAPTYNDVNTLANAFFESGSFAVTSSYLPLDIKESSILYIRLLHRLAVAAKNGIHKNWLAFISHLLRTSYIMSPLLDDADDPLENPKNSNCVSGMITKSMVFQERRKIYEKMMAGKSNDIPFNYNNRIPHYLMYSTLGRADLIEFESFSPKRWGFNPDAS